MKKIILFAVPVLALALANCEKKAAPAASGSAAIPVILGGDLAADMGDGVSASGKIEAANSANLSTRMMGYVTRLYVKTGDKVRAGQLLVSLNNADLEAKKAQAGAGVLQAAATYDNAKKDYDRFTALFAQQSASQKELDDITARYQMAKAALEAAKQMKNEVLAQFSYANITAPFAGEVTGTFVKEGDMANPGMPLVGLESGSRLQVTAMVAETDIDRVKQGMPAIITVKSIGLSLPGKVSEVSASAKDTGGQYLVKADLGGDAKNVRSGMFANVLFKTGKASHADAGKVLVPESALVHQGQLTGIYVVSQEKTAVLRWTRTGRSFGDKVEVLSGLAPGESYIASAEGKLYNGARISVQ